MALPPITEDDKPKLEAIIKTLARMRKRQQEHGPYLVSELTKAIDSLHDFGAYKGWWDAK